MKSLALTVSLMTVSCVCMSWTANAAIPHTSQNLAFTNGWNAVYVEVSPERTADELFAGWPVDHVGIYDPASFLATRQFSANWNSQGLPSEAMAVWYRNAPEASSLKTIPAGSVLVTFCNSEGFVDTFRGVPAAPRTTWHVTSSNTVHNFFGFSVTSDTDISSYLEGSPCENVKSRIYYRVVGSDPATTAQATDTATWDRIVSNGEVLLLPSDTISDWSGVLHVSPMTGINLGQTANKGTISIRNDGATNRTVRVSLEQALNHDELFNSPDLPYYLFARDMASSTTENGGWNLDEEHYYGMSWYKNLAPGETWNLEFGLRRSSFQDGEMRKGLTFGALLKVTEDSAAHAKVIVPIYGETSGETASDWQNGLWVANVELDSIRMVSLRRIVTTNTVNWVRVVETNVVESSLSATTPTGGKFKMRLPIHRDANGSLRLLQRVTVAGDVAANGTWNYKLYAGTATVPATSKTIMRISAVCLPTEIPVIAASHDGLWDWWGYDQFARFEFTVAPNGATSLLRHPYHPQHDGLRWDFTTSAPDGDNIYNYMSDVKPETFSVKSEIKMTLSLRQGLEEWDPEESFAGTCEWKLSGLRQDGDIVLSGPMSLKRVSKNTRLVLE